MITLVIETEPEVTHIETSDERLHAHLADGRVISVPLAWYPRLLHGTSEERAHYELSGGGFGIHWPTLNEDISIENLLEGRRSQERTQSFEKWLKSRA